MYERHFGLRENPFAAGHQSKYVYPSREHQEALAHLRFGIENREPFVLITGEVGTGKTTALYDALSEWKSRAVVALITNSALTRSELYEEICMRFGVPLTGPVSKPQLINQLERHLLVVRARGDFAILLIDEAQNLDGGLLEETRLLSNLEAQGQKLLQIFLVGQPELEGKLALPELRQLRQRIAVHYRLRPLTVEDTEHYIHHRISVAGGDALTVFPADACAEVHIATHGIPREINTVAAQALLNAFVEDSPNVRPEHVRAIVRDTGFQSVLNAHAETPAPGIRPADAPPVAPVSQPAPALNAPPQPRSMRVEPPAAESPVPVSPPRDAPAVTREVRHVPAPAPAPPRGPGESAPQSNNAEGVPMAGVRPAGSTESWQSWMDSLAKQTEAGEPEAKTDEASAAATDAAKPVTPIEMSPEAFYAVEEEAMRVKIGDEEDYEEASDEPEAATADPAFAGGFDPNESQARTPGESAAPLATAPAAETFEIPAAASGSRAPSLPDFESAPGFNWDTPAARGEPVAPIKSATPVARVETPAPVARIEPAAPWTPDAPVERAAVSARADEVMPAAVPPAPAARREAPTARVSAAPAQPMAAAKAMPIRLRERIEAAERAESSQGSPATGWIIGAAVLVIVTVGIVLAMRTRKSVAPTTHTSATTSAASGEPATETSSGEAVSSPTTSGSETPAASTPRPSALAAPPAAVAPRTSAAATLAKPSAPPATHAANPPAVKPAPSTPAPVVASVTVPKPVTHKPVSKTRFGVSVASFLAEERANTEGARLSAATGLASRVVATKDGDYRVVLGSFPDRAAAEQAAGNLIGGGKVDEARVISLGSSDK